MKKILHRNNKGMTMVEVLITVGIMSMVLVVTLMLLVTMLNIWSLGSSGTNANTYAAIAMRRIVLDIEEGMTAQVVDGKLQVTFPYRASTTSDYNRGQTGDVATYYLSGTTGDEGSGTYLWKSVGETKTRLARNVELQSLTFTVTGARLVRINLIGFDQEGGAYSPNMIQQTVMLRNG